VATNLLLSPASAVSSSTTTGTWYFHGPQASTTTTTTTPGTPAYKTAVRAPINADKSSNFPAKRGVVPVQFDLLAAPTTTTTTTTIYDPPVWKSLSDGSVTYAGLDLSPTLTFAQITNLSADYLFTTGDCFGGSLRWDIFLANGDVVRVYYGNPNGGGPNGQSCSGASSGTGRNLITDNSVTENRFELNNSGTYTTYAAALAATANGSATVSGVQLTLDSGWKADQRADVSNVTVNDNTWVPRTIETTTTTAVTGDFAKTCDLPNAELRWAKNDPTPTGAINEAESIQPKDTGQYFRQVDCKYIYNLAVSSLDGRGTYTVWARINGQNVQVPATFDLR